MPGLPTFKKEDYIYTPLFCEENIWQLCKSLTSQGISADQLNVLFLSNTNKQIILFNQRYVAPGLPLTYDYHVILKYSPDNQDTQVFDFDTHLKFPIGWEAYQHNTFPEPVSLPANQKMIIREIPASEYLKSFTSDRRHMAYLPESDHPQYECIRGEDSSYSIYLQDYWQMDKTIKGESKLYPYNY